MAKLRSCIAFADGSATSDSPTDGSAFLPDLADEQRSTGRGYFSAWYQGDPGTPNATHVDFLAFASATDAIHGVATMQASKTKLLKSSDPLSAVRHGNLVLLYSVSAATPAQTSKINACLREVNAGGSGVLTALTTTRDLSASTNAALAQTYAVEHQPGQLPTWMSAAFANCPALQAALKQVAAANQYELQSSPQGAPILPRVEARAPSAIQMRFQLTTDTPNYGLPEAGFDVIYYLSPDQATAALPAIRTELTSKPGRRFLQIGAVIVVLGRHAGLPKAPIVTCAQAADAFRTAPPPGQ